VVRTAPHATPTYYASRRSYRWLRQLIALVAILLGVWWLFGRLTGSGGPAAADYIRRALGVNTPAGSGAGGPVAAPHGTSTPGASSPVATTVTRAAASTATQIPSGPAHLSSVPPRGATKPAVSASTSTPVIALRVAKPAPTAVVALPASALLQNDYQIYETWNNCGPASLSMALSYFGIHKSQAELGQILRPYENQQGNNDDKDVTFSQLANEARKFGLLAYFRPNGNIQLLKKFNAIGLPVVVETTMGKTDDIGHYRVVKGYSNADGTITQDDSMQGHNITFSYTDLDYMWNKYNHEYLVLVPKNKQRLAENILGPNLNPRFAWQATVMADRAMLVNNPTDVDSRFNLSVALYYVDQYRNSVTEFEKVQSLLPFRTLWYQIEPIEAYYALGDYQTVRSLATSILNNGNRAFSQLYIILGNIDLKQGNIQAARTEFQNAVYYNVNLKEAQVALNSLPH
jgi:tetratricopeptide (TPR) repeat protein